MKKVILVICLAAGLYIPGNAQDNYTIVSGEIISQGVKYSNHDKGGVGLVLFNVGYLSDFSEEISACLQVGLLLEVGEMADVGAMLSAGGSLKYYFMDDLIRPFAGIFGTLGVNKTDFYMNGGITAGVELRQGDLLLSLDLKPGMGWLIDRVDTYWDTYTFNHFRPCIGISGTIGYTF